MAAAIKGTPKNIGLMNWSKKLSIMVSFKILLKIFLCFAWRGRLGIDEP